MNFRDRSVIITGASAGIGQELAVALAQRGACLTLGARGQAGLDETVARCRVSGRAIGVVTDVAELGDCKRLVDAAVAEYGGVDALVNNAGISMWARFDEITDLSIFDRLMRVNYLGAVHCAHHALPHLKARRGLLVGVSSLAGKFGVPTRTAYCGSKHAMQGFHDALRVELRGSGVDVLMVSPGFVKTNIRKSALGPDGKSLQESPRDEEGENMSVEDCVALIVGAMERREREVVMTLRARVGQWMKLVAPSLLDRVADRAVRRK